MLEDNNNMMPRPSGASAMPWVILAIVLLVFVVAGVLFRDRLFPSTSPSATVEDQATSGYQAVFLANGQVYFGKLSGMTASYSTLKDIYYLQVTTPPTATDASQLNQQQAQQQELLFFQQKDSLFQQAPPQQQQQSFNTLPATYFPTLHQMPQQQFAQQQPPPQQPKAPPQTLDQFFALK